MNIKPVTLFANNDEKWFEIKYQEQTQQLEDTQTELLIIKEVNTQLKVKYEELEANGRT